MIAKIHCIFFISRLSLYICQFNINQGKPGTRRNYLLLILLNPAKI